MGALAATSGARAIIAPIGNAQSQSSTERQPLLVARLRQRLLSADIARDDRLTAILQALKKVPSSAFLPAGDPPVEDVVALAFMAALLRARKEGPVLQVGFGSGYESAILGRISRLVMVEEGDAQHAQMVLARLSRLGTGVVRWIVSDRTPHPDCGGGFAHIFVTAQVPEWPEAISARLRPGGRMVARIAGRTPHYALGLKRRDGTVRLSNYAIDTLRPIGLPKR